MVRKTAVRSSPALAPTVSPRRSPRSASYGTSHEPRSGASYPRPVPHLCRHYSGRSRARIPRLHCSGSYRATRAALGTNCLPNLRLPTASELEGTQSVTEGRAREPWSERASVNAALCVYFAFKS
ncbi:hypothetical protein PsYK624_101150 [Phanerochaete sordida]|uniref:Uncharacterized protein n=1 Tax=Phanerochaete sordida TaxID=48140 RepID=A0A9P3GHY7_9APHY|nr:hypothetical protein PsYK624_101150 [Phanerochaete sordida]